MNKNRNVIILSIINVFRSFLLVGQALISKLLIDEAIIAINSKEHNLIFYVILFSIFIVLNIVFAIVYFIIKNKFSLEIEVNLKHKIYHALLKKDINEAHLFHSGELSNIYLNDVNNIKNGTVEIIPSFCLYISRFVLALLALIYLDPLLLGILLVLGVIAFVCSKVYSSMMKKSHKDALESDGYINAYMQESFENIKIVKAYNAEENFSSSLKEKLKDNYQVKNRRNKIALFGSGGLFVLMQLTSAFTLLYGSFAIAFLGLSYGSLLGLMQVVSYFESPLSMMSSLLSRLNAYKASVERVESIYALKEDDNQIDIKDFVSLEFDNVSFSYDKVILSSLSLTLKKGETLLLKGPSGSGKSTLFNLMLGFIKPNKGSIYVIDNVNNKYPISLCRKLFSYVPQENILFSGSIIDNVKLFAPSFKEDKLIDALKVACVYDEIMERKEGLNTLLIERGGGLSLGQIQRVLLAIALLMNRPILLLDEFTSALDKDVERKIVENISKLNTTKIIITHRDISVNNSSILTLGD